MLKQMGEKGYRGTYPSSSRDRRRYFPGQRLPSRSRGPQLGQFCNTGVCIHPEWIVTGAGLITFALAVFVLKPQRGERQP